MTLKQILAIAAALAAALGPNHLWPDGSTHPPTIAHPTTPAKPSHKPPAARPATPAKPPTRPAQPATCTLNAATPAAAQQAKPGDVVCLSGNLAATRLTITKGGTKAKPVVYIGKGQAVKGITIEANNVVVDGYKAAEPSAPGVELTGNNITLRNVTVTSPQGGDGDGLRFFGNDLKILNNTIRGTSNTGGRHADCMQTFASDTPPSQRVLIRGNRCEQIDNMCLMAEGPNDGEGDGRGTTSDFTIKNNYCETLDASQALMIEDIQRMVIEGNTFAAAPDKAIGLAINSTNARVGKNTVSKNIKCYVGIDDSSRKGYQGPAPSCES